jgi:hypothetical protein
MATAAVAMTKSLEEIQHPCELCGAIVRARKVGKEGPNKGKIFITCDCAQPPQRNFYRWIDADGNPIQPKKSTPKRKASDGENEQPAKKYKGPSENLQDVLASIVELHKKLDYVISKCPVIKEE